MKQFILIISCLLTGIFVFGQYSAGLRAGYLGTYTSVAEYSRPERSDFLLDSMTVSPWVNSLHLELFLEQELTRHLILTTGIHYSNKGLQDVTFTDSTGFPWSTAARQHYMGISLLAGYQVKMKNLVSSFLFSTGPHIDFAVGDPNGGALFAGPYSRFFGPVCRFNELDIAWAIEAGYRFKLGPGNVTFDARYLFGFSDVLEDPFFIGRTMSFGVNAGYIMPLGKK